MNHVLEQLVNTAAFYQKIMPMEVIITIADLESYVAIFDTEKMRLPFKVGDKLADLGFSKQLDEFKRKGKGAVVENFIPKEVTGTVATKVYITQVYDGDEVVGYLSTSLDVEKFSVLEEASHGLDMSIEDANQGIHRIAESASELNELMGSLDSEFSSIEESVENGTQAIDLIKKITKQTNLLGLNAAIEASRVGALGSGFAIVASEMRKLAEQSKNIAEQVTEALTAIETNINRTSELVKRAKEVSSEQSTATDVMAESIEGIAMKSGEVVKNSRLS